MKEKIYTIPLMDAFNSGDECPFCFIEQKLEEHEISFILGSAYMEDNIREDTDKVGFCRYHYKKMFDYGNALGNALMLKTHLKKLNKELASQLEHLVPSKIPLLQRLKKSAPESTPAASISSWTKAKEKSCYICNHFENTYSRYIDTFFEMLKTNEEFYKLVENSKGFCLPHFGDILDASKEQLNEKQQERFYQVLSKLMLENMKRVEEDVSWFVDKYDYQNKDADWKNSKDAIQRGMQKTTGGHPADPVFMARR